MHNNFGENLKSYRLEQGLTLEQLAEKLDTSKQVLSRYENNKRSPKLNIVLEYAARLGVPVSTLTGWRGEGDKEKLVAFSDDELEREFVKLFADLSQEKQAEALRYIRYLAAP